MSVIRRAKRTVLRCVLKTVRDEQPFGVLADHSIALVQHSVKPVSNSGIMSCRHGAREDVPTR